MESNPRQQQIPCHNNTTLTLKVELRYIIATRKLWLLMQFYNSLRNSNFSELQFKSLVAGDPLAKYLLRK